MTPFDRCPAATGVVMDADQRCTSNPDGAHRCRRPQSHILAREDAPSPYPLPERASSADHVCACSFLWTSGESIQRQVDRMNSQLNRQCAHSAMQFGPSTREITLPVTGEMAADFVTASPVLHAQPILALRLGDADLGQWGIVSMECRYNREQGNYYVATLQRKD